MRAPGGLDMTRAPGTMGGMDRRTGRAVALARRHDRPVGSAAALAFFVVVVVAWALVGVRPAEAYTQRASRLVVKISNRYPLQDSTVTVWARVLDQRGRAIRRAKVTFSWRFRQGTRSGTARTNAKGWAKSRRAISGCQAGQRVLVRVRAVAGGRTVWGTTWFEPRSAGGSGG